MLLLIKVVQTHSDRKCGMLKQSSTHFLEKREEENISETHVYCSHETPAIFQETLSVVDETMNLQRIPTNTV